jgi:catechol 2,3-dioxygenase-like lactoylglutathione lyase family enzyme
MNQTKPVFSPGIDNVNHVGIAVRDLAKTTAQYEAMGFMLTPYSPHSAAWKPGEPVKPLNSGNRCVMFADTYLEILASENPKQPGERIANFLKRHQGGHIVCFNSENAEAVDQRLRAAGLETTGVIPLQREIDTPEGVRTAKFARLQFAPKDSPEGYIQAARHLTPEYIYQPRYIAHPNGCTRLKETTLIATDLDAMTRRYGVYLGAEPERSEGQSRFTLSGGTILTLLDTQRAVAKLPGSLWPPLPGIAAVSFQTPDLNAQRRRLEAGGFTVVATGNGLLVPAEEASGVAVIFTS